MGKIVLIMGCMFSSKTSTLISRIERYEIAHKKCVVVKWRGDLRYTHEPYLMTHSGLKYPCIPKDNTDLLSSLQEEAIQSSDVVGVDEACFFQDIVQFCETLANQGKIVIVSTLIGTYQRVGFNQILNLIPKVEEIIMLKAVCEKCFADASFTFRTSQEKETEVVGGSDKYMALCRECFQLMSKN